MPMFFVLSPYKIQIVADIQKIKKMQDNYKAFESRDLPEHSNQAESLHPMHEPSHSVNHKKCKVRKINAIWPESPDSQLDLYYLVQNFHDGRAPGSYTMRSAMLLVRKPEPSSPPTYNITKGRKKIKINYKNQKLQ